MTNRNWRGLARSGNSVCAKFEATPATMTTTAWLIVVVVVRWRIHKAIGQAGAAVLLDEDRIPLIVRDCAKPSRNEREEKGGERRALPAREPALHNALSTATMVAREPRLEKESFDVEGFIATVLQVRPTTKRKGARK